MVCRTVYAASHARYPVCLGFGLEDLEEEKRPGAVRGFFYGLAHGIPGIEDHREGYVSFVRAHVQSFLPDAGKERAVLLFLIREELLDEEETSVFLDLYNSRGDLEAMAVLLQYRRERSGFSGEGDLSL